MEVSFFVKNSRNKQKTPKMLIQGPGAAGSQNFLLVLTPNLDFLGWKPSYMLPQIQSEHHKNIFRAFNNGPIWGRGGFESKGGLI